VLLVGITLKIEGIFLLVQWLFALALKWPYEAQPTPLELFQQWLALSINGPAHGFQQLSFNWKGTPFHVPDAS
jgi:hypothetical protein